MKKVFSHKILLYIIVLILAILSAVLCGCIKNDIPYPTIPVQFLTISAEGETGGAVINNEDQTVTLQLGQEVDISKVKILAYTITEGGSISSDITNGLNLNTPYSVTLSLYQDYKWTIMANQPIDRYCTIDGQVGESVIDLGGKRVIAYISKNADLSKVKITSLKLGPTNITTITPNVVGQTLNFSSGPVDVMVSYHNVSEKWSIYVERSNVDVSLTQVDAWTNVMWVYGSAEAGKNNGFEYRKLGSATWIKVPQDWLTISGGIFTACIKHLDPSTTYEVRAFSDALYSGTAEATTGSYYEIPNASFENWWKDGNIWCPWAQNGTPYWGTGNKGAATLGDSNTFPTTDTWNGATGYAAELDTKFVGISVIGKLAAGNMFTGDYVRTDGTNGVLNFGRPCNARPTRLKGYWKYKCAPINYTSTEYSYLKGRPDTAAVYIALTDWSAQYEIRTNPKNRQLFDKNADYVIAYGEILSGKDIDNWTQFTIDIKYKDTHRVPSYILIVSSASKYGDFFTGGAGSTLLIDNFWLEWDY